MIPQPYMTTYNEIYRWELMPNNYINGSEQTFSLYGILLTPTFIGAFLFYYVFEMRGLYFWSIWSVLILILGNIYFFYKRTTYRSNVLKLIIQNNYLQIMSNHALLLDVHIQNVSVKMIYCTIEKHPAIHIRSNDDLDIVIASKKKQILFDSETNDFLCQPDYWLVNDQEWNKLYEQLSYKGKYRHFK